MAITDQQLYQLLLENDLLTKEQLDEALRKAESEKVSLYETILEKDWLSDENLGKLVAEYFHLPFINLSKTAIGEEILSIIPEPVARTQTAIVFGEDGKELKVATCGPENKDFLTMLAQKTGTKVNVYYATDRDIDDSLRLYKKELQVAFEELVSQQDAISGKGVHKEALIPVLVDMLIEHAYDRKASDIHIEPSQEGAVVRFRIDGVLHDVLTLPLGLHEQIVTKIKVLARLRTDEHLRPQDGKIQKKLRVEDLAIRVSIVPVVYGEKVVLRLLTSHFRQFGLSDLGMSEVDLQKVKRGFEKSYGMVLSTGPTGSGKTTSVYAILKILNVRETNIATIEDPVEYQIEGVNQMQVNAKTNLTFATGLRSILRQDPNIIYVGEIRDEETADIAINSAMTGHLVLSTLHTNDAPTTLPRLISMNIESFLVASTVNVIIGQRLVRKICEKCKVSLEVQSSKFKVQSNKAKLKNDLNNEVEERLGGLLFSLPEELLRQHFNFNKTVRVYHGKGCPVCHSTGYAGRIGIFEVLEVTPGIQKLIVQKADAEVIRQQAIKEGMTTMVDDGLVKVQQGLTTIEEVLRIVKS